MKTRKLFIVVMVVVAIAFALMPLLAQDPLNPVVVTNTVAATNSLTLPPGFEQVVNFLPPALKALALKLVIWIGSFSALFAFVGGYIERWFRNKMNDVSAGPDQDAKLRRWFANPLYVALAWFLRLFSINLPTVAELDRAVALQKEAVAESKNIPPTGG